jgi:hypothetical protein
MKDIDFAVISLILKRGSSRTLALIGNTEFFDQPRQS